MKQNKLVPKIRFKEFDDSWQNKRLGEVSIFLDGRRKPIKSEDRAKMKGKYPYYGASGIIDYVNNYIFDEEIILLGEDGENIISRNLPLAFRVSGKCWVNNHAHVIKPNEDTDIDFLTHTLERANYEIYNTGTAQPKLNQEVCRNIPSFIPSFPEQKKIASFLSVVDEKIQQLTRKKELLEQYKKGVMQQLFSGKLRFKDENGKDYPEWVEKRLADIAEIVGGGTPETAILKYWDGEIQWYTPTEIGDRYVTKSRRTITTLGLEKSSAKLLPPGSILFTSRATIAELSFAKEQCTTNQGFQSLIVNEFNNSIFVFYSIKQNKKLFVRRAQGSTFLEISKHEMQKIKIHVPHIEEQRKIGIYLYNIDNKIATITTLITQTQTFKKGLLQQMFV